MGKRYYIDLCRKEIARVSYFPAVELKAQPKDELIETMLVPLLLPVARRKNKRVLEIPITFWASIRQTARPFREEVFLFMTPSDLNVIAKRTIEEALQTVQDVKVFAGLEPIPEDAFPVCQIFRGKLIKFYYKVADVEECYLPAFKWMRGSPEFALSAIDKSATILENLDSEILFMRANVSTVMSGEYYRKFQQALNHIAYRLTILSVRCNRLEFF
jgi:hypothetical protein